VTRLDLLRPPGCRARFPILSFALPLLALNEVSNAVCARLTLLFSREQRRAIASSYTGHPVNHLVSHYDLRSRQVIRDCLVCGAEDTMGIYGELDAEWNTVDAPEGFAEAYLAWLIDHRATHRRCRENRTHQPSVASP
jgi:hypothetical protein